MDGPAILVDAGIGPAGSLAADWAPVPGRLPEALAEAGDESLLVTGDLLVHAIQLLHPDLAYSSDMDPAGARASRLRMVEQVTSRGATMAVSHLGMPFAPH